MNQKNRKKVTEKLYKSKTGMGDTNSQLKSKLDKQKETSGAPFYRADPPLRL